MTNANPTFTAAAAWHKSACFSLGAAVCAGALLLMAVSAQAQIDYGWPQNLLVANDQLNGSVMQIDEFGDVSPFTTNGLRTPFGLAFDGAGNVYVGGGGVIYGAISEFTSGGTLITSNFVSAGLDGPEGLAFNSAGDLFVANGGNGTITEYYPNGILMRNFVTGLTSPEFLAFNSAGDLFVTAQIINGETETGYIYEFAPNGITLKIFPTGLKTICGLALDRAGNPYVTSRSSIIKSGVHEVVNFETIIAYGPTELSGIPYGLAFDVQGNLYAACGLDYIDIIDSRETSEGLTIFASSELLDEPAGIAFQPIPCYIYSVTSSQTIPYGATNVNLNGTISPFAPGEPIVGEPVTVTINGNAQTATILDNSGDFSVSYNLSTIPASDTPYTITYSYGGDLLLLATTDTSTTLTMQGSSFSGLTASQSIAYGTTNVTLSGTISTNNQVYPAIGEAVTVTINGNARLPPSSITPGTFLSVIMPAPSPRVRRPTPSLIRMAAITWCFPPPIPARR
ncbi:MAG: hypothetical protein ABSF34_06555 [Verrucomicrobiota bacterium]